MQPYSTPDLDIRLLYSLDHVFSAIRSSESKTIGSRSARKGVRPPIVPPSSRSRSGWWVIADDRLRRLVGICQSVVQMRRVAPLPPVSERRRCDGGSARRRIGLDQHLRGANALPPPRPIACTCQVGSRYRHSARRSRSSQLGRPPRRSSCARQSTTSVHTSAWLRRAPFCSRHDHLLHRAAWSWTFESDTWRRRGVSSLGTIGLDQGADSTAPAIFAAHGRSSRAASATAGKLTLCAAGATREISPNQRRGA